MAQAKTDLFAPETVKLATLFKAISHPARLAILEILARRNACVCGTIVEELPLAQATVSQHLKELKKAGLIQGNVDGPRVCYCIDPQALLQFNSLLKTWFGNLSTSKKAADSEAPGEKSGCC